MKPKYGITGKLFAWFVTFVLIFYGTILVLYTDVQKIVKESETIVNKNFTISSLSKKMIENLLSMEESEKKYHLLQNEDYVSFFHSAQLDFERNLAQVIGLHQEPATLPAHWEKLLSSYKNFPATTDISAYLSGNLKTEDTSEILWVPEYAINQWIELITAAQIENNREIEAAARELNRLSQISARNGLIGVGISSLVGLMGLSLLAYSMIRPLRELLKGIRAIPKKRYSDPIHVRSRDEFGEVAAAFNEMAARLRDEERMRSEFISTLSHEIRTPLTSIRESVNMIGEEVMGSINPKQRKFLQIAGLEIGRICDLLNDLMQVSRLESGVLSIQPQSLDAQQLIASSVEKLSSAASAKHITVDVHIPPDTPHVMGDPERMHQVMLNLLGNAIKFSGNKGDIRISVEPALNDHHVNFAIADKGPGIPESEQPYVFKKYYRAKNIRNHMDGVGLGLSISKSIVEAHRGQIWFSSALDQGSTFFFSLPTAQTLPAAGPMVDAAEKEN